VSLTSLSDVDVLILCGGLGKRLRPVIGESQKVMAEVSHRPFLDIILEYLAKENFKRIILCTGYKANVIEEYYQDRDFGLSLEFSHEDIPLGTGGAIKHAKRFVKSNPFFVCNGDSLCELHFRKFLEFHKTKKAFASIAIVKVKETRDFGAVKVDKSRRIIAFQEKKGDFTLKYVNAGVYCFEKDIFKMMPSQKRFSLEKDFFPLCVGKNFYGYLMRKRFLDIGTPERYKQARKLFSRTE
jgi:NDP-sugar pyrophosphorylase family protein